MTREFEFSRRKVLAALGTVGAASAGTGLGTSAFFSDQETFGNDSLVAGTLDAKVAYSAHYSDWSSDEDDGVAVRMWEGPPGTTGGPADLRADETGLPTNGAWLVAVDDPDKFLTNTQYSEAGDASCPDGSNAEDIEQPVIELEDVKPGDFGEITIDFVDGDPVAIDGERLSPAALLTRLNELGAANGIGRIDIVENRFVGMKSRGVYETPGGTILLHAHRAMESITLDREAAHLKDELMPRYAELIYNGFWFAPEREMLQALIDRSQENVSGRVRLKLYKGNVVVEGRTSPNSLYSTRRSRVRKRCAVM